MRRGLLWVLLVLAGGPNVPWGSRAGLRCPLAAVASPLIGIPRRDVFNSAAGDIAGTTAVSGGFQQVLFHSLCLCIVGIMLVTKKIGVPEQICFAHSKLAETGVQNCETDSVQLQHSTPHGDLTPVRCPSQGNKRELQEATLPDKEEICENQCVTVVRTAAALETAIKAGATNIEIRQHMNLTTLAETFLVPSTVRTIRVRARDLSTTENTTKTQLAVLACVTVLAICGNVDE